MARFVVPVVVLVALVGGYVVGQQPSTEPKGHAWTDAPPPMVGRFQLAANGESILDTVDGSLFKAQGERWKMAVSFSGSLEERTKQLDAVKARLQSLPADDPEREKLEKTQEAMERYIEYYRNR